MMRSMFSGVSSLRTHQTKMDVIAHNISNVNTVGFKSSRVTFQDVFSQSISGATRANDATGRGGTNPMQIGLGVNMGSIDKNMNTGAAQRTDRAMDLMINGDGFFIVGDSSGQYFTRAGAFNLDVDGHITMGNGLKVYGWDTKTDANGKITVDKGIAAPIRITGEKEYDTPDTTKNVSFAGNLNTLDINNSTSKSHTTSISFYDSLGNKYTTDIVLKQHTTPVGPIIPPATTPSSVWQATLATQDLVGPPPVLGATVVYPNGDRTKPQIINAVANDVSFTVSFDDKGKMVATAQGTAAATVAGTKATINIVPNPAIVPPAQFGNGAGLINIDLADLTQFGTETTTAKFAMNDGNAPGHLEGISVGSDGTITGRYSNGGMKTIGQIPVAIFKNPAGMESIGNNLFVRTPNSGDFDGNGQETSNLMGGVLEMSNVDLSNEFTEMITTQRGFQAGSRLITTSDEMLQELVNLKR